MKTKLLIPLALVALIAVVLTGCGGGEKADPKGAAKFHCPMHPTYVSDRQGDCPICGMRLVPIKTGDTNAAGENAEHGDAAPAQNVPGRVTVMVAPERRQTIGLATSTVDRRSFGRTIRTTATVEHDETRLARVAPRFGGWVRKLHVNYTGQEVKKGDPLFTAYSPDLFTTQNEFVLALQHLRRLTNSAPAQQQSARELIESARRRLQLMELGPEEINALEQGAKPVEEFLFRAPFGGHVVTKAAVEGKSFMAGETLYEIGDLSNLWLRASIFEYELPGIEVGQPATVSFPYLGNPPFKSEITFVYPHIDPQTRRAELRLELANPNHVIRPDMWANVEIQVAHGEGLAVPESAVIDTGKRFLAFVDRPDQHLEPRELKIGARADDYAQVLEGLKEGEKVVTRALFLVDSESQLKAAISGMAH